jgi:NTP pyrophosphatase (non-canonical NTP hydrolase)
MRTLVASLAAFMLILIAPGAAWADPDGDSNGTLEDAVAEISAQLQDAQAKVTASTARQKELEQTLTRTNLTLARLTATAGEVAAAMYKGAGGVSQANVILGATNAEDLLDRLSAVHMFAEEQNLVLRDLQRIQEEGAKEQAALNNEVAAQRNAEAQLAAQKARLDKLLGTAMGGPSGVIVPAPTAEQSPRNSDGSWPAETKSITDPTGTGGKLTKRTVHAYQEVKKAAVPTFPGGFNHFVSCWRTQSWGEHPKGRACDWASAKGGFSGKATGSDYNYGCRLAGWLIGNSDRLGVLYVIWYKMIWIPGRGWHKYTTEGGNPSGDHTNHVHMSMR